MRGASRRDGSRKGSQTSVRTQVLESAVPKLKSLGSYVPDIGRILMEAKKPTDCRSLLLDS